MSIPIKLIYTRYIISFIIGIIMGTSVESFSSMINRFIIIDHTGLLSTLYLIVAVIGCLAFLTTKINIKIAIWIPIIFDILTIPVIIYLMINGLWFYALILNIFGE